MTDGLTKLAPGKWRARITWRDSAGKRHDTDRVIEAPSKAQALVERERIREELAGTGDEWTVGDAVDAYLPTLRTGTRLARTVHLRRFRERIGESVKLSRVPPAGVQRWLSEISAGDDTANNHRASVLALYKWAKGKGRLIGANPIAQTIRRHTSKSSEELLAEAEAPEPRKAMVGGELPRFFGVLLEQEPELYPLMRCLLLLGGRVSEALALQWRDIDWDTGIVMIRRTQLRNGELGPTKGKRRRTAALGPEGLAFMRGHRAAMEREGWPGSDTWCFPRPITKRPRHHDMWPYPSVAPRVRRALTAAGLELECSTHAMRHSHVTLARALESDAALRATVGHADPKMTETYTDESYRAAVASSFASQLESRLGSEVFGGADVVKIDRKKGAKHGK
jgi:integrase